MDWDGSSNYMEEWYDAINVWNAYKPGVIRADRWNIIEDVHIYDKPKCKTSNSVIAMTFETGKIEFYQDKMDKMTKTQRQAVIEHEIGHALGLDDTGFWYAIMYYTGPQNFVQLHDADKAGYDAAWEKFVD